MPQINQIVFRTVAFLVLAVNIFANAQGQTCSSATFTSESVVGDCPNAPQGASCVFRCRDGYNGVNQVQRVFTLTCGPGGRWQGVVPLCIKTRCPVIRDPANGFRQGKCDGTAVPGDHCSFQCAQGYEIVGPLAVRCLNDGTWRRNPPTCRARQISTYCPNAPTQSQGIYQGRCNGAVPGDFCTLACNPGSTPSGSIQLSCLQDGTWSSLIPICTGGGGDGQGGCPPLYSPPNGQASGFCVGARPSETCNFSCYDGFRLRGALSSRCLIDGTWTTSIPTCIRTRQIACSNQLPPRGGGLFGICTNARPNDICQVFCSPGFYAVGSNPIICRIDGTWSASLATCRTTPTARAACPAQSKPRGGFLQGVCSAARSSDVCRVICHRGHQLVGRNPIVCRPDGRWNAIRARCIRNGGGGSRCPSLSAPTNGKVNGSCSNALPGEACTMSCDSGYDLSSAGNLVCLRNGSWDKAIPQCDAVECEDQDPVINAVLSGDCAPGKSGEECTLLCAQGYIPAEETITCLEDGTWSDDLPSCTKNDTTSGTCRKLIRPPNGVIVSCNRNVGGRCIFRCNRGYVIFGGPAIRTCLSSGQWTGNAPTCRRSALIRPG